MTESNDENPPLFKKWKYAYAALLIALVGMILFFGWFTNYFS